MGSQLALVVANQQASISSKDMPVRWCRYVDDAFVVWPHKIQEFLKHHRNIKFAMEVEQNKTLSFLDVMLSRLDEPVGHAVYRKAAHIDLPTFSFIQLEDITLCYG